MKPANHAVVAILLLAAASSYGAQKDSPALASKAAGTGRHPDLVTIAEPGLNAKAAKLVAAADKQCQCSEWKSVIVVECVQYDTDGNCAKTQTVKRRECVAWDHCH